MKLYTEEQLRQSIAQGFDWCHQKHIPSDYMIDAFIKESTPIELPTDEEIVKEAYSQRTLVFSFTDGAKWMRDQIKNK